MPKSLNVRLQTRGDNRKGRPLQPETTLVMSANSVWNIDHFRAGLIRGLAANGARTIVVAPGASGSDRIDIAIERSGVNPLRDAALVMAYRRILSRIRPAAYLSFTIKPNIYGAMAARLAGVPAIPNVSGLGTAFLGGSGFARFVSWLYRLAFRRCPTVFFQNRDDRDMFVARSIVTLDQARLVPGSGVDLGHFVPAMGDDPATSVTDRWGRTHDHENLFVVGAPTCVSAGCANGTLTFTALSLLSAAKIGEDFPKRS